MPARILVMDDDDVLRFILVETLQSEGYEVFAVNNGDDGLLAMREKPFDLVVTDIIMPGREGIETIIELRRNYPRLKILAMSGGGLVAPSEYLDNARDFGADRTLQKPFKTSAFLAEVAALLADRTIG